MDNMLLSIFQNEVKKQTGFALESIEYINQFFNDTNNRLSNDQLWYFVQNFLTSSANISKLLWGSNQTVNESRKALRESLDVDQDSILYYRNLRNHFEHYDERIETWFNNSERKNYVDSNIGPTGSIAGVDQDDFLRNYDTSKSAVTFKGEVYELQPLVDEMVKLNNKAFEVTKH